MASFRSTFLTAIGWYVAAVAVLWLHPLTRTLHAESSAAIAFVAFFVTGLIRAGQDKADVPALAALFAATVVPYVLLAASTLASPGCWVPVGSALFAAFVPTAVAFGAGLAYAIQGATSRVRRILFVISGLAVTAGSVILDLKFHPQFYSYGHTFGGILGPLYDSDLAIRPGVFTFRIVTLLWTAVLWAVGLLARRRPTMTSNIVGMVSILALALAYTFRGPLGFNTTYETLRTGLPASHATEHFEIRYDPTAPMPVPIRQIADEQEYQYYRLEQRLGTAPDERISVFLYPDAETKAHLTGSRTTSVAPVWLSVPQIHLLTDRHEGSFGHELVHVFAREFGAPVVNASYSVGLVEGLAVALEPPSPWIGADEQVRIAARAFGWNDDDVAKRTTRAMSPTGFWTDRGAIAYALSGSFAGFLLDQFGASAFKDVYRHGDYESGYGIRLDSLTSSWATWLLRDTTGFESAKLSLVAKQFSVASLFERSCPHVPDPGTHVPDPVRDPLLTVLTRADSIAARGEFDKAGALYDSLFAAVEGGSIERASTVASHRALAFDSLGLSSGDPLVAWHRLTGLARSASAAGSWESAEEAWAQAAELLTRPGMEPYRYAIGYAEYKRMQARWLQSGYSE